MAKPKRKRTHGGSTIVRGPDGVLYLLSKKAPPLKLTKQQSKKVTQLIKKVERKLEKLVHKELVRFEASCTQTTHIEIPDVLME